MKTWNALVEALATREPATSLALFRMLVGAILGGELTLLIASGALRAVFWPVQDGGVWQPSSDHWLVVLLGGPSAHLANGLVGVGLVAAAALVLGVGARPAGAAAWLSMQALLSMKHGLGGAYDTLLLIALFFLAFARSDATLSMACRVGRGSWTSEEPVPAWPRFVLVYQLALLYSTSAWAKLGAEWLPAGGFRAVYNALLLECWARAEWRWLGWVFPLTQVGTVVSWCWEATWWVVPLWLVLRARGSRWARYDVRVPYVAVGLVFHLSLWVLINVGPFSPLTSSFYVLLFAPFEWRALFSRLLPGPLEADGSRTGSR